MFTPTNGQVVVLEEKEIEEKTPGGIFVPGTAGKNPLATGKVVAVSDGSVMSTGTVIPCCVEVGQYAIFDRHTAVSFEFEGVKYLLLENFSIRGKY